MRVVISAFSLLVLAGCGGGSQAPADPSAHSGDGASSDGQQPAGDASASLESQRDGFMQGCMKHAQSHDYCQCSFEQFKETFKGADLSQPIAKDDPRLQTLQERTAAACAEKLDEKMIQANFLKSCVGDDQRKETYCSCAWPALRKNLEIADFVSGDTDSPRFLEAKKGVVADCKGKFPLDIAKADFMKGCLEGHPEREKSCVCLWGKIKAKYSTEEIATNTVDVNSVPGLADCNKEH